MKKEQIEIITPALLKSYTDLTISYFGGITNLLDYIAQFNDIFQQQFQDKTRRQIDPYIVDKDKLVTCNTTAMFTGLWWLLSNPNHQEPTYWTEDVDIRNARICDDTITKPWAHTVVELKDELATRSLQKNEYDDSTEVLVLGQLVELKKIPKHDHSGYIYPIGRIHPSRYHQHIKISNPIYQTGTFFANRLSTLGMTLEGIERVVQKNNDLIYDPSARKERAVGSFRGQYQVFLAALRHYYANQVHTY